MALVYQPLSVERNEIRLLYFQSDDAQSLEEDGNPDAPAMIRLEMRNVSLDDYTEATRQVLESTDSEAFFYSDYFMAIFPESEKSWAPMSAERQEAEKEMIQRPDYGRWIWGDFLALSYVWGDADNAQRIIVNDCVIQVTMNLWEFLHHFKNSKDISGRRGIWIDAISVNQGDTPERNSQVKRMGEIYSRAHVIAWLGKDLDRSQDSMKFLRFLADCEWEISGEQTAIRVMEKFIEENEGLEIWNDLFDLFSRPYWKRLWVVQEVGLAGNNVVFCCGDTQFPRLWLRKTSEILLVAMIFFIGATESGYLGGIGTFPEASIDVMSFTQFVTRVAFFNLFIHTDTCTFKRPKLNNLLITSKSSLQKDDRDKVYGILSLMDPNIASRITPNYESSIFDVYTDFTRAVIESTGSLDVICQSRLRSYSKESQCPSWVPNLSEDPTGVAELAPSDAYQTSRDTKARVTFDSGILAAEGFIVGQINGLGGDFLQMTEDDDFESLAAVRPNVPLPGTPYPQETSINEVLWRTLVGNRDLQGRVAPASFSRLLEIPWKACGASSDLTGKDAHTVQMIRLPIFNSVRSVCQECQIDGRDFQSYFPPQRDVGFEMTIGLEDALTRVENALTGRRLMTTTEGYLGLAIRGARQGDLVAILYGCSCPVILRRGDGAFHFVGEAYVHGIMDGEAMDWLQAGKYQPETFTIK